MKTLHSIFFISCLLLIISCGTQQHETTQDEEQEALITQYQEITEMAKSESCEDAANWKFTPIGAKACGGPTGFIAYSKKINEDDFLKKVATYTNNQKTYNKKWGIVSDCMAIKPPQDVSCTNGSAELVF
ncbi:hypothetical protein ACG2LH_11200 [Zhouia sp. PK063]|uniref:hypothetical protein n=1 Tax=Zhouia sp. PK063 TaxID=3373602 RepID=UPI0037A6E42B